MRLTPRSPSALVALVAAGALGLGALVAVPASGAPAPAVDDPSVTFLVGLPRDSAGLQAAATKRATPGTLEYRDFMTLAEAATAYGATDDSIRALRRVARKAGVTVRVDTSRMLARLTAPLSTWEGIYGADFTAQQPTPTLPYRQFYLERAGGQSFAGAPRSFASVTSGWVAQSATYVPEADLPGIDPDVVEEFAGTLAFPGSPRPFPLNRGTPLGSTCGQPALENRAVYNLNQVRKAYGSARLARQGMTGAGTRLTIVSLGGGYDPDDLALAAECFGHAQPLIDVQRGTGVPEPFRNASDETHLDLITASAVVPGAESIKLLQAVGPLTGLTDAIALSLNHDGTGAVSPDVVSVSYGTCELDYATEYAEFLPLNEDLFALAALVGTSVLFAAGDNGTSMCGPEASLETERPLVWYPASSPWVTAVGGTRLVLGDGNARDREVVWNDTPYIGIPGAPVPGPGGAGGPSAVFDRPWYQAGSTVAGPRALPDVSLLGALKPGWPIYYGGTLYTVGGTSGGAPFLAANLALIAAAERGRGYPGLGFVNPWFYGAGATARPPFFDVRDGNNAVQDVPCCVADRGYDMASGLGVPLLHRLPASLPLPAG